MKKTKEQRGITLIALIITIIILLILAVVTITSIKNGKIIEYAKQAKDDYNAEKEREEELIGNYLDIIKDSQKAEDNEDIKGGWEQNGDEIKFVAEDGTVLKTLTVGQTIVYDEGTSGAYATEERRGTYATSSKTSGTYTVDGANGTISAGNLEWMVLGLNDAGQVEVISSTPTTAKLTLYGKAGYLNAVTDEAGNLGTLDTFCNELYGKGKGAISARSIAPEDYYGLFDMEYQEPAETSYTFAYSEETGAVHYIKTENITEENKSDVSKWSILAYGAVTTEISSLDWTINSSSKGPYTARLLDNQRVASLEYSRFRSV